MGRAARLKAERRARGDFEVEVICPGMLEVLSVGKGDLKITMDPNNAADVAGARALIEEMLAKGYGIFVETDDGLSRVKKFNPKRMTYIITEFMPAKPEVEVDAPASRPKKAAARTRDREVPVAGSKAKAIGRTSGG